MVLRVGTTLNVQIAVSCLLVFADCRPRGRGLHPRVGNRRRRGDQCAGVTAPVPAERTAGLRGGARVRWSNRSADQLAELRAGLADATSRSWTAPAASWRSRRRSGPAPCRLRWRPHGERWRTTRSAQEIARRLPSVRAQLALIVEPCPPGADPGRRSRDPSPIERDWASAWPSASASLVALLDPTVKPSMWPSVVPQTIRDTSAARKLPSKTAYAKPPRIGKRRPAAPQRHPAAPGAASAATFSARAPAPEPFQPLDCRFRPTPKY